MAPPNKKQKTSTKTKKSSDKKNKKKELTAKEKLQIEIYDRQEEYVRKSLIKKKKPPPQNNPRDDFVIKEMDLTDWSKNMPLDEFLNVVHKNTAYFIQKRVPKDESKGRMRRKPLEDLLSFFELTFGDKMFSCVSDTNCMEHMVTNPELFNQENHKRVLIAMKAVIEDVIYAESEAGMSYKYMGQIKKDMKKKLPDGTQRYPWFTKAKEAELRLWWKADVVRYERVMAHQKSTKIQNLQNAATYPETELLQKAEQLKEIVEDKADKTWIYEALALAELSGGGRWVEPLVCAFQVSPVKKYDPDLYIQQTGAAKESAKVIKKFKKAHKRFLATEEGIGGADFEEQITEQDLAEMSKLDNAIIVKPIIFHDMGIKPAWWIQMITDMRRQAVTIIQQKGHRLKEYGLKEDEEKEEDDDLVALDDWYSCSKVIDSVEARQKFASTFYRDTVKAIVSVFGSSSVVLQRNKTHAMRKLYVSYCCQVYFPDSPASIVIQWLLGHESVETSFYYLTLKVKFGHVANLKSAEYLNSRLEEVLALNAELSARVKRIEAGEVKVVKRGLTDSEEVKGNEWETEWELKTNDGQTTKIKQVRILAKDDEEARIAKLTPMWDSMLENNVDVASITNDFFMKKMGFTRVVWKLFMKRFRRPWEEHLLE